MYEKAISLDPGFADAYAGHARAIVDVLGFDFQPLMLSAVARQQAYESAGRALELNPKLPRAYAVLGILQMLDGEIDRAIESVQRAVELDPNGADAKLNLAIVLTYAGRHPEALAAIERVLQLDPKPKAQVYDYYGLVLYMNHRYEEALKVLRSVGPDGLGDVGLETLAMASAQLGRMEDAHGAVEAILKRIPSQSVASLRVMYGHHRRPEDLDHRMSALLKAGLPEWCFGFSGRPEDRLDASSNPRPRFGQDVDRAPPERRALRHAARLERRFRGAYANEDGRWPVHARTGPLLHAIRGGLARPEILQSGLPQSRRKRRDPERVRLSRLHHRPVFFGRPMTFAAQGRGLR